MTENGRAPLNTLPSDEAIAARLEELDSEIATLVREREGWLLIRQGRQQIASADSAFGADKGTVTKTRTKTLPDTKTKSKTVLEGLVAAATRAREVVTLADTILALMRGDPAATWTAGKVFDALTAAGWTSTSANPKGVVATQMVRMFNRGDIERVEEGVYRLAADDRGPNVPVTDEGG